MSETNQSHIVFFFLAVLCCFVPASVLAQDEQEETTGKPERIWSVKIEGNETFSDIVIKRYISNESPSVWEKITFFNESGYYLDETEVLRDEIRIRRFYNRHGFDEAIVTSRLETRNREWKKTLIFEVQEGTPILIDTLSFEISANEKDRRFLQENSGFQRQLQRLPFKAGRRYEPVVQPEVEGRIVGELKRLGYPYARVNIEGTVDSLAKQAAVDITAFPGPRARFDSVLVEGNTALSEYYIIRESGLQQGEYYTDRAVREAQREVYNHHLFRFALVSVPEQVQDTTVNVQIRVRELSPRSIEIRGGLGNFDRIDEPLGFSNFYKLFRSQATWTHRNVRNRGERFTTAASISAYEQQIGMDYLFPYVFNTKSNFVAGPFLEHKLERSYEIMSGGLNTSLIYLYSQNMTSTFSYDYSVNNEVAVKTEESLPDTVLNYNVSSFSLNGYYSRGLREGRRGWAVQPYIELSGIFNEASYSFEKLALDIRKFTEINDNLVLATRAKGGLIFFTRNDSLPSDIRFYNGGTNTVRGYGRQQLGPKRPVFTEDENGNTVFDKYVPLGGESVLNFNVELRQNLNQFIKGFGIAGFLDGGQVWSDLPDLNKRGIQYGLGGGIRYSSPIGPIRVDFAYKVNPTDEDLGRYPGSANEGKRWRLHFSIGQAF